VSETQGAPVGLDDVARRELARWKVPGLAVAVLRDGAVDARAYGITSLETRQPVTPETLFQIGSVSKVFTATLVMCLVEEGLLDLDQPVATYLPDLRLADETAPQTITLRHLLTHSSGIEGDRFENLYGVGDDALAKAVAEFQTLRQVTTPGSLWTYSNNAFSLAGAIVERVLGTPFETAMSERIFAPLKMIRSFYFAHEAITYPVAVGHTQPPDADPEIARNYPLPRYVNPAGGIISPVGDLLRFATFHLGDGTAEETRLLSQAALRAMQTPQIPAANFATAYGLGWAIYRDDEAKVLGHGGSTNGFQAQLTLVPAQGFAIAQLTNSDRGSKVIRGIEDWALHRYCGLQRHDPATISMSTADLARFAGRYRTRYTESVVTPEDGGLRLDFSARSVLANTVTTYPPMTVKPISNREFIGTEGEARSMRIDFIGEAGDPPRRLRAGGRIAERVDDSVGPL
jgi:CubicO group peptidase (beta-lactamase class C family)